MMEAGLSRFWDGFTARLQAVGKEGALPALLLPFFFFSDELQSLITHSSGRTLKISDLIISFALRVAVKSMCCQGYFVVVGGTGLVKGLIQRICFPQCRLARAARTFPAEQVLSCKTWMG